jgi:hypothetical protein
MNKKIVIILVLLAAYYQLDYKIDFIYSNDKSHVFTVWKRLGYNFYIIPGKYYLPYAPNDNYIYSSNQGMSVLFNTNDSYHYKLSVFYKEISENFDSKIKVYRNNDSLLLDYGILKELNINGSKRVYHKKKDSLRRALDYRYIDLNRIYGIKIFDFKED